MSGYLKSQDLIFAIGRDQERRKKKKKKGFVLLLFHADSFARYACVMLGYCNLMMSLGVGPHTYMAVR